MNRAHRIIVTGLAALGATVAIPATATAKSTADRSPQAASRIAALLPPGLFSKLLGLRANPRPLRLTLLHNNDGESKLLTGDSLPNVGGAARYATRIGQLRAQADSYTDTQIRLRRKAKGTLNVSSGDNILAGLNYQGSLAAGRFYDSFALNRIGYDAVTLGNHDFDFGPDRLADLISETDRDIPYLSANLGFDAEPRLKRLAQQGRIAPSTVVQRQGVKIGVIGLTTPLLRSISTPRNVTIADNLAEIVNAEVARLERRNVKVIVLSSHLQGLATEKALVPQLSGVDVVIAGGGDELLINDEPKVDGSAPFGPYPDTSVRDKDGAQVPIVTTQGEYRYVGRLTAEFDSRGRLASIDRPLSGPVRVVAPEFTPTPADAVDRDAKLVRQIDEPLTAFRTAFQQQIIARSSVGLDGRNSGGEPIRRRETNLGNLVADGFLHAGRRDAAQNSGRSQPDVALTNSGGIRNNSVLRGANPAGQCGPFATPVDISVADTFAVLAFGNQINRVPVTAAKLKELLEHGFARLPATAGQFPQIAGMRVDVDYTRTAQVSTASGVTAPGQRVRTVRLLNADGSPGDLLVNDGVVAAPARALTLITTGFLAAGGDNYPFAGTTGVPLATATTDQQSLVDFLTQPTSVGGLGGQDGSGNVTPGPHVTADRYPFGAAPQRMALRNGSAGDTAYPACP